MNESVDAGVTSSARSNSLGVFFALALFFVFPKPFFVGYTLTHGGTARWCYIVAMDFVPAALIALWVYAHAWKVPDRHIARSSSPDPLLTIRFAACVTVIFGHYFGVVFTTPAGPGEHPQYFLSRILMSSPWAGVWMFFTLSGYLMGKGFFSGRYAISASGAADFLWNRAFRIYPVYLFALLVIGTLSYPKSFEPENLWILVQTILMDYDGRMPINIIGALWSVTTEFQFYLLAPLLAFVMTRIDEKWGMRTWMLAALLVVGATANIVQARLTHFDPAYALTHIYLSIASNLYLFVAGMMLAKLRTQKIQTRQSRHGLLFGFIVLVILLLAQTLFASYWAFFGNRLHRYFVYIPPFVAMLTLLTISIFESSEIRGFGSKIVKWTQIGGTLTYCAYVFHPQIMLSIRPIAPQVLGLINQIEFAPLIFSLIFIVSYVMHRGVEHPASKFRR
ncbi:acyltransferase family protein [Pararobbsia silviterrae]|nr:acyltransferase [Pararobbsia silviterrae]